MRNDCWTVLSIALKAIQESGGGGGGGGATKLEVTLDNTTYVMTFALKSSTGTLSTTSVELPFKEMISKVEYEDTEDHPVSLKLTLKDGSITYTALSDLVPDSRKIADHDLKTDITKEYIADAIKAVTVTLTNKTVDCDDNTVKNIETDNLKDGVLRKKADGLQTTTDDTHIISEALAEKLLDLRLKKVTTMPTAAVGWLNDCVMYTGTTTTTAPIYTNGHIYKCVVTAGVYSWAELGCTIDTIETSMDSANNLTITLKSNGVVVSTSTVAVATVSIVRLVYYDAGKGELVLEFSNGQELRFNIATLISGMLPLAIGFTFEPSQWVAQGTNYIYDLTSTINTILGAIPVYTAASPVYNEVTPAGTENPSELHWCELDGTNYKLSTDTTVDTSKTYYKCDQNPTTEVWYEKDGSDYNLSTDTWVNPEKTYFIKSNKELNGTYQFDFSADSTAQSVIDSGSADSLFCVTTKVGTMWKLYAYAIGGKPTAQITLPTVMVTVAPSQTDMSLVGKPVYKSVASVPTDTMTLTNKTVNADNNTISDLETDNFKSSAISTAIPTTGAVNTKLASEKAVKDALDNKIDTAGTGLSKSGTTLNHSNSVTANTTSGLKYFTYDAQGHVNASVNKTLGNGITDSSNVIGHSNSVTANTTSGLKFFTYDAQGHVTGAVAKTLGRGVSDSSNVLGHSNSVTAQTTQKIFKLAFDEYGHITGATELSTETWSITFTDGTTATKTVVLGA